MKSLLAAKSPAFPKDVHRRRKSRYECDGSDDGLDRHLHLVGQSWILADFSAREPQVVVESGRSAALAVASWVVLIIVATPSYGGKMYVL